MKPQRQVQVRGLRYQTRRPVRRRRGGPSWFVVALLGLGLMVGVFMAAGWTKAAPSDDVPPYTVTPGCTGKRVDLPKPDGAGTVPAVIVTCPKGIVPTPAEGWQDITPPAPAGRAI